MFGENNKHILGGKYLRVKADEPVRVAFVGEERVSQNVAWTGQGYEVIEGGGGTTRFAANVYLPDTKELKILEGPLSLARDLYSTKVQEDEIVMISRTGQGRSTRFIVARQGKLSTEDQGAIKDFEVHDLSELWRPREGAPPKPMDSSDNIPF